MIRAEHISDAVARLADEAYYDTAGAHPTMSDEDIMKHAIAAALNAWPGIRMMVDIDTGDDSALKLPLPQEASDE